VIFYLVRARDKSEHLTTVFGAELELAIVFHLKYVTISKLSVVTN